MVRIRKVVAGALVVATLMPLWATAQPGRDFRLGAPRGSLTLRTGYGNATASGAPFDLVTEQLTLGRGDFASPSVGADVAFQLTSRVALLFSGSLLQSTASSEFREFVRDDNSAIRQTTSFRRVPVTVGARFHLLAPGQSVGRLAWIPNRVAPWVAGAVGMTHYRFAQDGEFVDSRTFDIFPREFSSSGWSSAGQAMAGVDLSLNHRMAVTLDGRYLASSGELVRDFVNFSPRRIDLSGFTGNAGITFRF
jgi:opacity protein-like surface antigen